MVKEIVRAMENEYDAIVDQEIFTHIADGIVDQAYKGRKCPDEERTLLHDMIAKHGYAFFEQGYIRGIAAAKCAEH